MAASTTGETDTRIPVTILTGFLGAGKTTLLNHILQSPDHGMKFAVIENEFGAVGIDDGVLKQESSKEQIIEMMNGCICCTVRADLGGVLVKLADRMKTEQFDAVIIETTGLADPSPVAQTFYVDKSVIPLYKLDGIITVVDTKHILQHVHNESRDSTEKNEAVEQIAFADRIILNKVSLVDATGRARVRKTIREINRAAEIIPTDFSKVDPAKLLNIAAFDLEKVLEFDPRFLEDEDDDGHGHGHSHGGHEDGASAEAEELGPSVTHKHGSNVSSVSFKFEADLNVSELQRWIGKLMKTKGKDLYRYKGILSVKGMAKKFVFQGVHMLFTGNFSSTSWGVDEKRECRFVFIGQNLDEDELTEGFLACKVEEANLRFKVGDLVQANVGTWTNAKVIKVWDEGNPYRLEIEDGKGTQVWGPQDTDVFVRARPE